MLLPDLNAGCTTIWHAAMGMTGHDPTGLAICSDDSDLTLGIGSPYTTRDNLIEWMDLVGRDDTPIKPMDFFITLLNLVDEGLIRPLRRVSVVGQNERLDPFCTIIAEAEARAAFERMQQADVGGTGTPPAYASNAEAHGIQANCRKLWMQAHAAEFLKCHNARIPIRTAVPAIKDKFPGCSDKDARALYRTLPESLRRVRKSVAGTT